MAQHSGIASGGSWETNGMQGIEPVSARCSKHYTVSLANMLLDFLELLYTSLGNFRSILEHVKNSLLRLSL